MIRVFGWKKRQIWLREGRLKIGATGINIVKFAETWVWRRFISNLHGFATSQVSTSSSSFWVSHQYFEEDSVGILFLFLGLLAGKFGVYFDQFLFWLYLCGYYAFIFFAISNAPIVVSIESFHLL